MAAVRVHPSSRIFCAKVVMSWSVVTTLILITCANFPVLSAPVSSHVGQSRRTDRAVGSDGLTRHCGDVCKYDDMYSRAHCDNRNLTFIPSCTGCEGATLLELQENSIENIPPERIGEYVHVRTLDVSWNQISLLHPGTFISLNYLKNVICFHNSLDIVPNGVFNGTEESLTRIYLNNNNIVIIGDKAFKGLSQVANIYLNNNRIQVLPSKVFSDVTGVKRLNLADNELNRLEEDHFKGLTKLITLSLQNNNLKEIPEGLFVGLESLKEVYLSANQLITISSPQNLGLQLVGVERLDLRNNHLNRSDIIIPYLINTTWTAYVGNNPFPCDCYFQSIQHWYGTTIRNQTITSTRPDISLMCTFSNGVKYRISDPLPIICNNTHFENIVVTGKTSLKLITHNSNNTLVKMSPHCNLSFTKQIQNTMHDEIKQLITDANTSKRVNFATLFIAIIFFVLWVSYFIYLKMLKIRGKKKQDITERRDEGVALAPSP